MLAACVQRITTFAPSSILARGPKVQSTVPLLPLHIEGSCVSSQASSLPTLPLIHPRPPSSSTSFARTAITMNRVLLALFSVALTLCLPSTLFAQPDPHEAEGVFSGWAISSLATHPTQPLVHLVDQRRYIHTVNLTDGRLIREGYIVSGVESYIDYLTVDSRGNTYAVLTNVLFHTRSVLAMDEQLQPRHEFRLDIPSELELKLLDRPLLADSRGMLYVAGQLLNGSHMVYTYEGSSGKQVDSWLVTVPVANLDFVVNMDDANFLYFQQTSLLTNGYRYTFLFSTGGVWSDAIATYGAGCTRVTSLAITSKLELAQVCDGVDIRLFASNGRPVETFQYIADGSTLTQLDIDYRGTLVVVTPSGGGAVVAVSADGGGAKHLWRPSQSSFLDAAFMLYDPFTDSLLTWHSSFRGASPPVQRVDTRSGALLDLLTLPARLTTPVPPLMWSNCYVRSAPVGRHTGHVYRLLTCAVPYPALKLYVTTAAGQVKRELTLMPWTNRFQSPLALAVDEELDIALVSLYGLTNRFAVLFAFSLSNGTALYNVSLGNTGFVTDLTASHNHTALLTLPTRILLINMLDGTTLNTLFAPAGIMFTSAAYDGQNWYIAQSTQVLGGPYLNGSVVVWDSVSETEVALLTVGSGHRQTWAVQPAALYSVTVTDDGRVFALDRYRLAAWWDLRRHKDTTHPVTGTATAAWSHRKSAREVVGTQL